MLSVYLAVAVVLRSTLLCCGVVVVVVVQVAQGSL